MDDDNKKLGKFVGNRIKERRKALGLTQADLARLLDLSHQQVQRYESGENTISVVSILRIAQVLNIKPDYFYQHAPLTQKDEKKDQGILSKNLNRPLRVLLIEDTYSDELLFRKAVEQSAIATEVAAIQDARAVMPYLTGADGRDGAEPPDIVLLDINMPHINGLELIKQIRGHEKLRNLPVVMLTNSVRSKDMLEAYASYANGFVQKNSDLFGFFEDVNRILEYWSRTAILPSAA